MQNPLYAALPVILSVFAIGAACADRSAKSFEKEIRKTIGLEYLLYEPEGYGEDQETKWPLVIFLHGAGERGDDLELVKIHGPPKLVAEGKEFPFLLVSPQCPKESWWTDQPVLELVDHLEETLRVDPARIYLTGLSMGGYGTWHFTTRAPERFAAIAPVCGGSMPYAMRWITRLPVWAFHGAKDTVVPLDESERLIKKLEQLQNKDVKLTVYPEAAHDSWTEAYATEELYTWLLSHSLPADN